MERLTVVCCECRRVIRLGDRGAPVSHGYCRPCKEKVLAQIDRYCECLEDYEKKQGGGVGTAPQTIDPISGERIIA